MGYDPPVAVNQTAQEYQPKLLTREEIILKPSVVAEKVIPLEGTAICAPQDISILKNRCQLLPRRRLLSASISPDNVIRRYNLRDDLHFRSNLLYTDETEFSMLTDYYEYDKNRIILSYDAARSVNIDNAGGKSVVSEMLSIDYFNRVFNSNNTLLEMEIDYWARFKMVDFITTIRTPEGEERVGVSVTRAMGFPTPDDFESSDAERLINKKLYGLIVARNSVQRRQRFFRSVLHVWCQTSRIAEMVSEAYERIENKDYGMNVQGTVSILLTVCPEESLYNDDLEGYRF